MLSAWIQHIKVLIEKHEKIYFFREGKEFNFYYYQTLVLLQEYSFRNIIQNITDTNDKQLNYFIY